MQAPLERKLTELDHARLDKLRHAHAPQALIDLLDESLVLPSAEVGPEVIALYSRFIVRDLATQQRRVLAICHPEDTEPAQGSISALSPAGLALLGLPVGATARWSLPGNGQAQALVEEILFQPEPVGDYAA